MEIRRQGAYPARLIERAWIFINDTFPERQLIYRSQGRTRYLLFSRSAQIMLCSVAVVALTWIIYASSQVYLSGRVIDAKDQQIAVMEMAYDSLTGEWADTQQRFLRVTGDLEAKHLQLLELFQRRMSLEQKLGLLSLELDRVMAQREDGPDLSGDLTKRGGQLEMNTWDVTSDRYMVQGFLSTTGIPLNSPAQKHRDALSVQSYLSPSVDKLESARRSIRHDTHSVQDALSSTKTQLNQLAAKHLRALRKEADLRRKVSELGTRLAVVKSSQRQLVERVKDRTQTTIGELESLVAATGLPPRRLLERSFGSAPDSRGGPLVQMPEIASEQEARFPEMDDTFSQSVGELEDLLRRWASLQLVLDAIPLTAPIRDYRVVSGWGKRRDPFTKRWAFHRGVDFAAYYRTPVLAPAPGKVSFVGRKGPYGKMVEIDHGIGVKTRYGHLRTIHVKRGQTVGFRQKIGQVGSTGRSTGPHVHYEIHFDGKPVNPGLFIKAGRHVFKE